jgi:hypothetical protein
MFVTYGPLGEGASTIHTLTFPFRSHSPITFTKCPNSALCTFKDIMFNSRIIRALKLKMIIQYIKDIASPDILILPSLTNSPRMVSRSSSFIPAHLLSLVRSILPSLLASIQRTRSRGDCGGMSFSQRELLFRHVHRLYDGYSMFEYQDLTFHRLDQDLIGLASRYQPNGDFLASECWDKLRAYLFWYWLGRSCFFFCHLITSRTATISFSWLLLLAARL